MSGGSETIRRSPSMFRESFENACTLSRLRALATTLSRRLRIFLPTSSRICGISFSISKRVYQTSRLRIRANCAIRER